MRILLAVLLLLLFVPSWSQDERLINPAPDAVVRAEPVAFDVADPARRRAGQLTWLGGIRLTSPDPAFGGYSALTVDGGKMMLLSDGGGTLHFTIDRQLRISGARFGTLPAGPSTGWRKRDRDSESITRDATGSVWVGFENSNEIWRYSPALRRALRHVAPAGMRRWDSNGGAEAMVRLDDSSFLVFSETSHWPGRRGRAAIRFAGDPTLARDRGYRFSYLPPPGYDPSDAAQLPDGRVLVLNRRLALPFAFSAKLTMLDPTAIRRGALVRGREIATLAAPLVHDNFEGLAVTREGRDTILWIVSDDNQSILQKTLLLKFRLEPGTR